MTPSELLVGAAEVEITPPVGTALAGSIRPRNSVGVQDPLTIKAIVLSSGGVNGSARAPLSLAYVLLDLIALERKEGDAAVSLAARRTGIPEQNIVWAASHTHTGPYTVALFDGEDDGQTVGLAYDVGMGAELFDDSMSQQWFLESRQFRATFATAGFQGYGVERAWLDFTTAAPSGSADFSDTFTGEVVDDDGAVLGSFASTALGPKRIEVPAASVHTDGDTSFIIRSTRADSADRTAWTPGGPDYTSTYREGLAVSGPIRLIVEVNLEYHG